MEKGCFHCEEEEEEAATGELFTKNSLNLVCRLVNHKTKQHPIVSQRWHLLVIINNICGVGLRADHRTAEEW